MIRSPRERVLALVDVARRIADPRDPLGVEARRVLPFATGLTAENVELGLTECLETHPSDDEIAALCASVPRISRAHVVLSANVFVAAHRAIALALAAAERPRVRASRREPEMTRLLSQGAPGLFDVVTELRPKAGDHVFAYGSDETMRAIETSLPQGVVLHAHGSGMGIVVTDLRERDALATTAREIARDVVPFDQRGCLSPRVVLVTSGSEESRLVARALSEALRDLERRIPRGALHAEERAGASRFRDAWLVAGDVLDAGSGFVTLDDAVRPLAVPPPGRHVHVRFTPDLDAISSVLAPSIASVGIAGTHSVHGRARALFPEARIARPGAMQRPPFDGPVDRRAQR